MNTYAPALVCEKYKNSRVVAFSSGNVYGLTPVAGGGSLESAALNPVGEYALSALGRERIFEYFSHKNGTPTLLLRLNYAVEMRYGVLVDIARNVFQGKPIDVTMGHFNVIWQGDANAQALQAFDCVATPARVLNITGPEIVSTRWAAGRFAEQFGKKVALAGTEAPEALLNNAAQSHRLFSKPGVSIEQMIEWIANWVRHGRAYLDKPTHFDSRDGKF
jgi:nucleoside-diphosphate-sugar epimerase